MSRVKWVEGLESSMPEVMHLYFRADGRFYRGTRLCIMSPTGGYAGSAAGGAMPRREDT